MRGALTVLAALVLGCGLPYLLITLVSLEPYWYFLAPGPFRLAFLILCLVFSTVAFLLITEVKKR